MPERFRRFYKNSEGITVNDEYLQDVKLKNGDCVIPKLVVARDVSELHEGTSPRHQAVYYDREYDENGFPIVSYGEPHNGLERYCVFFKGEKPLYVFDNHVHVLFAWQEAREAGVIGENTVLVRLDAHSDMGPNGGLEFGSRHDVKRAIEEDRVDIKNFTDPAMRNGLISEVYFFMGARNVKLLSKASKRSFIANQELDTIDKYAKEGRFYDISDTGIEDPEAILKLIRELRKAGKDVVLDIDFDVFTREEAKLLLPYLPAYAKEASMVTIATSPSYIDQKASIDYARNFIDAVLKN